MGNGILMLGVLVSISFGDFGQSFSQLVVFGGVLWAISNYLVLPLVKLLGLGLGFSLYHFVNLMVGYIVGRVGLFGVAPLRGNLLLCDAGCLLILVSFIAMIFVEQDPEEDAGDASQSMFLDVEAGEAEQTCAEPIPASSTTTDRPICGSIPSIDISVTTGSDGSRRSSRSSSPACSWTSERRSNASNKDSKGSGCTASWSSRTASASSTATPTMAAPPHSATQAVSGDLQQPNPLLERLLHTEYCQTESKDKASDDLSGVFRASVFGPRCRGVLLALFAGGFAGVQSVPATLYSSAHPNTSATATVFPQCLGIWIASSVLYVGYASYAKIKGWRVPHAVIRPALVSGAIWCLGFAFMIWAIKDLGYAVGYTLDAVGPIVVASLLSIFLFREITAKTQLILYGCAFTCQIVGVIMISAFGQQGS